LYEFESPYPVRFGFKPEGALRHCLMKPAIRHRAAKLIRSWKRLTSGANTHPGEYGSGFEPLDAALIREFNDARPLGPQKMLCYAPFKMMYFAFGGEVIACCHNRRHVLGNIQQQSLEEIWKGKEYELLREFIRNDDLNHGCEVCKNLLSGRNFDGAKNSLYDRYSVRNWPRTMEFELDNTCNLACVICNDLFSSRIPGMRQKDNPYGAEFVEQLRPFIPHLKEAKFYGGEPFLIPIYYQIWDLMMKYNPSINILIQTNGTVLNEKVRSYLARGRFSINVSIDSFQGETFEKIRKHADFSTTMENLEWFRTYCYEMKTHLGIIPTPNRLNWEHLPEITRRAGEMGARVYFNTLITPLEYALWNLPPEELNSMHARLSAQELPDHNTLTQLNKKHFGDFLLQLLSWRDHRMNSPIPSGITAVSPEMLKEKKAAFLCSLKDALISLPDGEKAMKLFLDIIGHFAADPAHELIYLVLEKIPTSEIVKELSTFDREHLIRTAGKKIFEAEGLYAIQMETTHDRS
jgi:radical SAM protein with 4Fe4S-binding SPASM domain